MRYGARQAVTASSGRLPGGVLLGAVVLGCVLLTGCSGATDDEGGFGLPVLSTDAAHEALTAAGMESAALHGVLSVQQDGCFTWAGAGEADGAWIVWPESAQADPEDGARVRLDGGAAVGDGSSLTARAGLVSLDDLPDGANPDGYFGSFGGFCGADERGVLVLLDVAGS